jgi:hypothetical protein
MTTCEYETDIDVDPFPERCGKPATAEATDGATGEVHHVCDEHAAAVEGIFEVTRLCVPQTTRTWNHGAWREVTTCATHTYFGNGVEPNCWPCLPETRVPGGSPAHQAWAAAGFPDDDMPDENGGA